METLKYFETVEKVKEGITEEEFSRYKKVLYGTDDPYIVTYDGKVIVKACPGDNAEK